MRDLAKAKTLHAGGLDWTVVDTIDPENFGKTYEGPQQILVDGRLGRAPRVKTLCHELAHAAGYDEDMATRFEYLAAILLDNEVI